MQQRLKQGCSFLFLLLLIATPAVSAPKSDLWEMWSQSDETNSAALSHSHWQELLDRYLVISGQHTLFNYAEVSPADKQKLAGYISGLAAYDPRRYRLTEQYAYWVNLYNAVTVKLVLDEYPVKSITKLGGFFSFGPWNEKVVTIARQPMSLNDIEHRILRPIWKDPRTHYVVNCASMGCPNLQPEVFTADNCQQLLDKAAHAFINSEKGVDMKDGKLALSSIYDWYADDFGNTEKAILSHIDGYRETPVSTGWKGDIDYRYNWDLNRP